MTPTSQTFLICLTKALGLLTREEAERFDAVNFRVESVEVTDFAKKVQKRLYNHLHRKEVTARVDLPSHTQFWRWSTNKPKLPSEHSLRSVLQAALIVAEDDHQVRVLGVATFFGLSSSAVATGGGVRGAEGTDTLVHEFDAIGQQLRTLRKRVRDSFTDSVSMAGTPQIELNRNGSLGCIGKVVGLLTVGPPPQIIDAALRVVGRTAELRCPSRQALPGEIHCTDGTDVDFVAGTPGTLAWVFFVAPKRGERYFLVLDRNGIEVVRITSSAAPLDDLEVRFTPYQAGALARQ
ncbi:hypothetical protein OAX78_00425 [Planctomycetota bacterium]|nr:hypothetical protein [Planctomycetota bacterium]